MKYSAKTEWITWSQISLASISVKTKSWKNTDNYKFPSAHEPMKRGRVYKNVFNTLTANVQPLMFKPWICTCVWCTVILEHTCILPVHCLQVFVCGQKDCFLASSRRGLTLDCLLHLEAGWQFKTPSLLRVSGQGAERCPTWLLLFMLWDFNTCGPIGRFCF